MPDPRDRLEADVPAVATSVDGRRFSYQASLHGLELEPGSYVVLDDGDERRLGQVVTVELARTETAGSVVRHAAGEGRVLAGPTASFHDAGVRPATADEVASHVGGFPPQSAGLSVGELVLAPGVPLSLDAGGFGRHTFLCGQSGSGKTYSLGVVLERLLLETTLRLIVLDPNSDFVRIGELRPDADGDSAARFDALGDAIAVRRAGDGLGLRFPELGARLQAAALRLDPIDDREEYAELLALVEGVEALSLERLQQLSVEGGDDARRLLARAGNLGLDRWGLWAGADGHSITADLTGDLRCLVLDLGSLDTREEQTLTAATVLSQLWERRAEREPVLIVIDEAHNICPAAPSDPLTAIATELAVRIAGEGRKFGLHLLASTQRPQKLHEDVLSQCDNLLLMRMNSLADLDFVGDVFSFVPRSLLERSPSFAQGESLAAGAIAPHPALFRVGRRLTAEGGGDVGSDWSAPRS
jgi:DNA helicase HerA-like ATPase